MIIVDVLALATTIGACAIGTLLAKYQPIKYKIQYGHVLVYMSDI